MDWAAILRSWDSQQEGYMADREERFSVITDLVSTVAGPAPRVLDLGCGPGSLSRRVTERLPGARVVAVDFDPVLLLIARRALDDERITWLHHDLADAAWEERVASLGPFDAVVSTTALHWLADSTLGAVYAAAFRLLRDGGVLANGDHLFDRAQPRLADLQERLRVLPTEPRVDYATWWADLQALADTDSDLTTAFAHRAEVGAGRHGGPDDPHLATHETALRAAGFPEVGTVWQHGDDRVLVALR